MTRTAAKTPQASPLAGMKMSPEARARMRITEKLVLRYYNDMGKNKGNCTWGSGFLAHRGVCTEEELLRKVEAASIDIEYDKRIREAEERVRRKVRVALNRAQFDALVSFTCNTTYRTNQAVYDAANTGNFAAAATVMSAAVRVSVGTGKDKKYVIAPGLIKRRAEESAPFRTAKNVNPSANEIRRSQ
jgi:GH24 family phage-related lysozyme (muramidase)